MARWEAINAAPPERAREELRICCGAPRWVERMLARRPFANREAALAAAREEWFALAPDEWREAFTHHPRIGALGDANALSQREQSGVSAAGDTVRSELARANREYEARFGYIFIVCASGKTAEEMLEILRRRLENDPATEIREAAEEHAKICGRRLTGPA